MSDTAQGVVPVDLSLSLGALEIGTHVSMTLFGVMSMQTYYFYVNYPNEQKLLKGLVVWIWYGHACIDPSALLMLSRFFELLHAAFVVWNMFMAAFQNSELVPLAIAAVWGATVTCSIQAFFAYWIHILSQCWEIILVCWTLSLMQYLTSLIAATKEFKVKNVIEFDYRWKWIITVELAVTVANDIIIAMSLSYYLYQNRSGIPPNWTSHEFLAMPDNYIWVCIFMFLAEHEH
ncbi:hypothetical protein M0805_008150, partial [Coniferiporia weirii]